MAAGAPPRLIESLPDDLVVEEILVRLPPDDPASLLRASFVSKAWGRAISSPAFRRRLHEFHRTPPLLGFLHNWTWDPIPRFIPTTTASSFSVAAPDCRSWRAIDCRHGRALFLDQGAHELLVWEPITGAQRRVPVPSLFEKLRVCTTVPGAAVVCAADGCDHLDCHGGPFKLVFVFSDDQATEARRFMSDKGMTDIWACVFASETGTWGRCTPMKSDGGMDFGNHSSVLVGTSLLYFMVDDELILEYDLARHSMTEVDIPDNSYGGEDSGQLDIILTEDGGLGFTNYFSPNLTLWTKEASDGNWVLSRVINLMDLLPIDAFLDAYSGRIEQVLEFVDGTNTIFVHTDDGIFIVELQSGKARKVCDCSGFGYLAPAGFGFSVPVVSFYTPVPRG